MIIQSLIKQQVLKPGTNIPKWLADNTQYLVQMGSVAYGCNTDDSDMDIYGFCIPPKDIVFPYASKDHVYGFGPKPEAFDQWQMTHIKSADGKREYDFAVYNIIKYFQLVAENNPNMISSIWVPQRCVMHITSVGQIIRDRRREFLHKGMYHKFKGYAFSQLAKMKNKKTHSNPKRSASIKALGYDSKAAYHVVRLCLELKQVLETGDMDIQRDREVYKSIRKGEWKLEDIESWFTSKEQHLNKLYEESTLPHSPDWDSLRQLLLDCLEVHYGRLELAEKTVERPISQLISELEGVIDRFR